MKPPVCTRDSDSSRFEKPKESASERRRISRRIELGDSIADIADNSVDLVLFCEIIEHISFNPIPFGKQIYRVLLSGGRIIVTTPNSMYHGSLSERLTRLWSGSGYGPRVEEIIKQGTYGHHRKEFSVSELHA
ncbi:class I SAM-dependent methyltransferase [Affinirhizobium pseudoryzae]|uniref:class I SAM-dependent methyltransferase n=1 Tax=Allorhizobium pseudoryzae TaxID=379684 RepID=UPI0013EACF28